MFEMLDVGEGVAVVMTPDGEMRAQAMTAYPDFLELQRLVGGHVVKIREWTMIAIEGQPFECVVFCNEDGLPMKLSENMNATERYYWSAKLNGMLGPNGEVSVLVGTVVAILGNLKIVDKLRKNW